MQVSEVSESTASSSASNIPFADEEASSIVTPAPDRATKDEHPSSSATKSATKDAVTESVSPSRSAALAKPARSGMPPAASASREATGLVRHDSTTSEEEGHGSRSSSIRQTAEAEAGDGPPHVPVDSGSEADEFQDEIHFDPTVSSGHLGYKEGGFRNTPITLGGERQRQSNNNNNNNNVSTDSVVDEMTPTEAENMLSTELLEKRRESILSDEQAEEVVALLTPEKELPPLPFGEAPAQEGNKQEEPVTSSDIGSSIDSWTTNSNRPSSIGGASNAAATHPESALDKLDNLVYNKTTVELLVNEKEEAEGGDEESLVPRAKEAFYDEVNDVHVLEDGHYWFEIPAIDGSSSSEELPDGCYKAPTRLKFSDVPIRQYSTYAVDDYDRRNDEVDPVAASAEYELEKRVEKMDTFPVDLSKGSDGLGLSIIGMGVGADTGLEKLGIFVKTITPGGSAERDGRIHVNDQIIEVDGRSLVGVTQAYAASVLRNTSGVVEFVIGRDKDPENSEVAQLIRQSLQVGS